MDRFRLALHHERRQGYRSVLHHNEGARTIIVLIGLILAVLAVLLVVQRSETTRRTGTAAIQIVSLEFQPPSGFEQSPQGTWVRYFYVVGGTTYPGVDFRRWTKVEAHEPKVCFDPADPKDHFLVDGRVRCGIDSGP